MKFSFRDGPYDIHDVFVMRRRYMSSSVVACFNSMRENGMAMDAISLRMSLLYSTSSSCGDIEKIRVIFS